MKCAAGFGPRCWAGVAAVVLGAVVAGPVCAEQDYEFAKALMGADEPSFGTEDLVLRLIAKLDENAANKPEAALIKAALKRRQAKSSSVISKSRELLDQAKELYKEVLAGDPKFRLYSVAEKEKDDLDGEIRKKTRDLAKENSDPAKRREICAEAAKQVGEVAQKYKTAADAAKPLFDAAYKRLNDWSADPKNATSEGGVKPPPREITEPLEKHFEVWIGADRRCVATKVDQLECYDESDPEKKTLAAELAKHCDEMAQHEALTGFFPVISAWYSYMLGRTYAGVQDVEKATEAWRSVLNDDKLENDDFRKAMFGLKRLILVDLVKMKMRGQKYSDVEGIIFEATIDHNLKSLFDEDAGKDLMVDYARALTLKADASASDFEKALNKLRDAVEKEQSKNSYMWANQFARTMAEILYDARVKNIPLRLPADAWYQAAHGYFLMGQNEYRKFTEVEKDTPEKAKEQFEKAYYEFRDAIEYYCRAISVARSEKTALPERLEVEPKSWLEMGIAYVKMKQYYEAIVVFQSLRSTFLEANRKRWMPDPAKSENRKLYRAIKDTLVELDKTIMTKSGTNIMVALDENLRVHKDPWNRRLKPMILGGGRDGEELVKALNIKDAEYIRAKTEMEEARSLVESAKESTDPKLAEDAYRQAVAKYAAAGDRFFKVPANSDAYEPAMYQAGSCRTIAQELLTSGKLSSKKPAETESQAKDLAQKALNAYEKYLAHTKAHPLPADAEDDDRARRQMLEGAVLLARSTLHAGAGEWEQAVQSADAYIKWEQGLQEPLAKSSVDVALLNKFRGNLELTGKNLAPACDPYLKAAEAAMEDLHKWKPNDKKLYVSMLNMLSGRYNMASFQAAQFIRENKMKPGSEEWYEDKVAELQAKRVECQEEDPKAVPSLEDYSRLVYLFNRTGRFEQAVSQAKKLLETFDKNNKNVRIPDEPKVWQALLARMRGDQETNTAGIIRYSDMNKDDRCKRDHAILIDYMYDTREGRAAETAAKRPAFDKYNMDMERALKQLQTIVNNYTDCQTLPDSKTKKPIPAAVSAVNSWIGMFSKDFPEMASLVSTGSKAPLTLVEEEIDFRRKVQATRELLSTLALEVAEKKAKEGKDEEAKSYRETAHAQIKILRDWIGDTPAMKIKTAEIEISNGKFSEALDTLINVKADLDSERDWALYFDVSRKISEVRARMKDWKRAVEYPEGIAIMAGFKSKLVREKWPRMKEFLDECYANGAPKSPKVIEILEKDAKGEEPKKDAGAGEKKADGTSADVKTDAKTDVKTDAPAELKKADTRKEEPKSEADKSAPK